MINNPMQQIERTQDAYAGNPEGLQKRANMSKELIDLLAMQALQSDLAAQKRNMAMQQQGNPQTVKDQLEEGLMGEYRQKAAEDLGVGPSEGDVVERTGIAGQQMARNQQMPQGPQGMPQGGGGVASQAGPVKLAGGGIVSFYSGGPISEITDEDVAEYRAANPLEASLPTGVIKNKIYVEANPQFDPIDLAKLRPGGKRIPEATVTRREAPLNIQEEERKGRAGTAPPARDVDVSGIASLPKVTGPTLEQQGKAVTEQQGRYTQQRKDEAAAAAAAAAERTAAEKTAYARSPEGMRDQLRQKQIDMLGKELPEFSPPPMNKALQDALESGIMTPDQMRIAGEAREERVRKLMGIDNANELYAQQLIDLEEARAKATDPRRIKQDRFFSLLGGLGDGGTRGANKAGRAYEAGLDKAERQFLTDKTAIDTAKIALTKAYGEKAATSYDNTITQLNSMRNNSITALTNLNAQDRADYRTAYSAGVSNTAMQGELMNNLASSYQKEIDAARAGKLNDAQILELQTRMGKNLAESKTAQREALLAAKIPPELQARVANSAAGLKDLSPEDRAEYDKLMAEVDKEFAAMAAAYDTAAETLLDGLNKQTAAVAGGGAGIAADADFDKYKG